MRPENKLLRRIAAIPAGEKLPLSRFARELHCSAAVVVSMIEGLVAEGRLDRTTLRPPARDSRVGLPRWRAELPAAPLVAEIDAFLASGAMGRRRFTRECLRSPSALPRLRKPGATVRRSTAERIRAFIAEHSSSGSPIHANRGERGPQAESTPGSADRGGGSGGRATPAPSPLDSLGEQPTGEQLVAAIRDAARAAGRPPALFAAPVWPKHTSQALEQLAEAIKPKRATIARVRALLAGEPIPPPPPRPSAAACRRDEREARGLAPSARELNERHSLERVRAERDRIERKRAEADRIHAEREARLREVIEREAAERLARRNIAQSSGSVRKVIDASAAIDDALIDRIDTASDRRARELEELASPGSVLRRAQRDWPGQCDKVKAIAAELGVSLAEAWRRVIAAGVDCLTEDEDEGSGGAFQTKPEAV